MKTNKDKILVVRITESLENDIRFLREQGINISAYVRKCLSKKKVEIDENM